MASPIEHRLIHLDLKGAAPKFSYYEQIFPLLHKWGATGLLIEYEDTFPYAGELEDIALPTAYTPTEVKQIQDLGAAHNLEVIPLVQTFGHFEFVLKHEKFKHLREIPTFPMTLCPLHEESLGVLSKMFDQIVTAHPGIKYLHIGADEVFHLGVCKKCHKYMMNKKLTKEQLFFMHMRNVLELLSSSYPHLKFIMWDDMFRHTDVSVILESNIGSLVEPMVWYYHTSFKHIPDDMFDRYSQVFDSVWIASAFKGATGPCMFVTDIAMHVENHKSWLKILKDTVRPKFKNYRGCAITGWQRYDHYAVLCELLPVGFPSLAVCLFTLTKGSFTEEVHDTASQDLGFKERIPLSPFTSVGVFPECSFPGWKVYIGALRVLKLKQDYKRFMKNERINGWMTPYHIKHNYTNPAHLNHFLPEGQQLLNELTQAEADMSFALSEIFHPDTVDEWISVLVKPKIEDVSNIMTVALQQIAIGAAPKDQTNMDQT